MKNQQDVLPVGSRQVEVGRRRKEEQEEEEEEVHGVSRDAVDTEDFPFYLCHVFMIHQRRRRRNIWPSHRFLPEEEEAPPGGAAVPAGRWRCACSAPPAG